MIWSFEVLLSLYFGYLLVSYLAGKNISVINRFLAGPLLGFLTFAWITFITNRFVKLDTKASIPAFVIMSISCYFLRLKVKKMKLPMTQEINSIQLFSYIIGGWIMSMIIYYSLLRNGIQVKGAAYGDLPFHMNIISSFAHGVNNERSGFYDIKSLFYNNTNLAYPFITNYFSAVLMVGGATMQASIVFPSIFVGLSLVAGIYTLSFLFTRNHVASAISLILFSNLGGLGFIYLLDKDRGYMDYIYEWGKEQYEYWFHPIFHVLIPQRASLWSMPLCYFSLIFLIIGIKTLDIKLFILAGLYVGFMPLIQVHSYVGIAQWAIAYAILTFPWTNIKKMPIYIKIWAAFGISANVMAFPQLPVYFGRLEAKSDEFVQIYPIWYEKIKDYGIFAPVVCWWRGLGVFGAVSLVFGWITLTKNQCILYIPSIVVFVLSNIIRYQPWEMDNTKIFYAAWIPIALPVVSQFFAHLLFKKETFFAALLLIVASCLSALLHTLDCLTSKSSVTSKTMVNFGLWISENLPTKCLIVSSSEHNHPVAIIGGRVMFGGYPGWLSSHGLEWDEHEKERARILSDPNSDKYEEYGIDYAVFLSNEEKTFGDITNNGRWVKIYDKDRNVVYRLIKENNSSISK